MAPTAPSKRRSMRAKALERLANPHLPRKLHRPDNAVTDSFLETKRDKRLIKHSSFVSKISKDHPSRSSSSAANRRRRPSKKLVTTLESLADALPELTADDGDAAAALSGGKVRHRSLRSRPGALKRKEKIVRGEMERFGVSLAQLTATKEQVSVAESSGNMEVEAASSSGSKAVSSAAPPPANNATSNRWAALRGFISATMEQNPAFAASKG